VEVASLSVYVSGFSGALAEFVELDIANLLVSWPFHHVCIFSVRYFGFRGGSFFATKLTCGSFAWRGAVSHHVGDRRILYKSLEPQTPP
jgi:hypothetical protein